MMGTSVMSWRRAGAVGGECLTDGKALSTAFMSLRSRSMSMRMLSTMPGLWTFTATSSPVARIRALYTWSRTQGTQLQSTGHASIAAGCVANQWLIWSNDVAQIETEGSTLRQCAELLRRTAGSKMKMRRSSKLSSGSEPKTR